MQDTDTTTGTAHASHAHEPPRALPAEPNDGFTSELELDPANPGLHDEAYVARRAYFFQIARKQRIAGLPVPEIRYEEHEHTIWRAVWRGLELPHATWACRAYLRGKRSLTLSPDRIPSLPDLHAKLQREVGIGLVPAEGLMNYREFFVFLAQGKLPCTIYLRHGSQPQYATEPDVVHDVMGHMPMLVTREYVDFVRMVGRATRLARTEEELRAFNRLYFFAIEFGLIEEDGEVKVFGAGLLSSSGEMQHAYSGKVEWRSLDIDDIVNRSYDPYSMQNVFYVIPSFDALVEATCRFIRRLGIDPARV